MFGCVCPSALPQVVQYGGNQFRTVTLTAVLTKLLANRFGRKRSVGFHQYPRHSVSTSKESPLISLGNGQQDRLWGWCRQGGSPTMSLRPLQGCNEDFTLCLKLGDLSSGQFSLGLGGNDTIFCPPNKVIIASDDLCRGQVGVWLRNLGMPPLYTTT